MALRRPQSTAPSPCEGATGAIFTATLSSQNHLDLKSPLYRLIDSSSPKLFAVTRSETKFAVLGGFWARTSGVALRERTHEQLRARYSTFH